MSLNNKDDVNTPHEESRSREYRKATLADVAKHAQVSTATVSRCFSDPDKVTPALRAKVEASISTLSYTPHGVARALATQRSRTIGVIVPTLDIASFAKGVQALQERLFAANNSTLLAISNYDREEELRHAKSLIFHGVDGIVLVGLDHDPSLYELLERSRTPFVNTWAYDKNSKYSCIGFDNRKAVHMMTDHVLDLGHRNIAMIVGGGITQANDRSRERKAGFIEALKIRNIANPDQRILEVPYSMEGGRIALRQLMSEKDPPTAIICGSDLFAIGAMLECQKLGINIPDSLSITGFDDLEISKNMMPALTTVHVPAQKMGMLAAEYLLSCLDNDYELIRTELDFNLIIRDTVHHL
ncbi:LacI family DNA-binding transcriptional regulator [Oceanisphaera ostreae]|uniref:LacI family DNA-binding transcriptional regulator n=1 Tax=Oceanisphaera ostreae TaxID=914151 RepID=A0ABW3KKD6_9GAMM